MDLGAYAQINTLDSVFNAVDVTIYRLRGLRLMKFEKLITQEEIDKRINYEKVQTVETWLKQHSFDCWTSDRDEKKHPAFIYDKDNMVVDYDFSKIHGKDRKRIKFAFKKLNKRYRAQFDLFNKYVGKNVLYVHARQGGDNRFYYDMTLVEKHPRWLSDIDDAYDCTYCDIYFNLDGLDIDYEKIKKELENERI